MKYQMFPYCHGCVEDVMLIDKAYDDDDDDDVTGAQEMDGLDDRTEYRPSR